MQVSLVTAVHDREAFVAATAASVLAQTHRDFEWIVFDDGCRDASIDVIRGVVGDDPRVRFLGGSENHGGPAALRLACAHARQGFVGWLDSDDLLAPDALRTTARYLHNRPRIGMVGTRYRVIDAAGRDRGPGARCRVAYSPRRLLTDFMLFHFRLYRREAAEGAGGVRSDLPMANDYDFCLRMSECCEIHQLPDECYRYRVHPKAMSTTRRVEQVEASAEAIGRALVRRGLDATLALELEWSAKFHLRPRDADEDAGKPTA